MFPRSLYVVLLVSTDGPYNLCDTALKTSLAWVDFGYFCMCLRAFPEALACHQKPPYVRDLPSMTQEQ